MVLDKIQLNLLKEIDSLNTELSTKLRTYIDLYGEKEDSVKDRIDKLGSNVDRLNKYFDRNYYAFVPGSKEVIEIEERIDELYKELKDLKNISSQEDKAPLKYYEDVLKRIQEEILRTPLSTKTKSPPKPVKPTTTTICSYNILEGKGIRFNDVWNKLEELGVSYLFTQETGMVSGNNKYQKLGCSGSDQKPYDKVCLFKYISAPNVNYESISTNPPDDTMRQLDDRNGIIMTLPNGLLVGSLHLAGGRFVDQLLIRKLDDMDFVKRMIKYRNKLLKMMIEEDVDIIVGDFNTFYSENPRERENSFNTFSNYIEALKQRNLSDSERKTLYEWNMYPIDYLQENDYSYVIPKFSNRSLRRTSYMGNNIIDMVWCKKDLVDKVDSIVLSKEFDNGEIKSPWTYSDHTPVLINIRS